MTTPIIAFGDRAGIGASAVLTTIFCLAHLGCSATHSRVGHAETSRRLAEGTTRPSFGGAEASTRPTPRAGAGEAQSVRRLTGLRWVLLGLQQKYLAEEGINHRGRRFEKLVNAVGSFSMQEPMSEIEMLDLLGAPDYGVFDAEGGEYAYVYTRSREKDSVANIRVSRLGFVDQVSYGAYKPEDFAATPRLALWPEQKFAGLRPRLGGGFIGIEPASFSVHKDPRIIGGMTPHGPGNLSGVDPGQMIPCLEVAGVLRGSPASRADLRTGDLILAIDGNPIPQFTDRGVRFGNGVAFVRQIGAMKRGTVLTLTIRRGTEELKLPVTVGRQPDKPYFGLQWVPASRTQDGGPQGIVVKVSEIEPGSPAERAGLLPGDIIEAVDGSAASPWTFTDQVLEHQPGEPVTLTVLPAGKGSPRDRKTVTVIPTTRPASPTAPQQ